jgi:hypothetical protein
MNWFLSLKGTYVMEDREGKTNTGTRVVRVQSFQTLPLSRHFRYSFSDSILLSFPLVLLPPFLLFPHPLSGSFFTSFLPLSFSCSRSHLPSHSISQDSLSLHLISSFPLLPSPLSLPLPPPLPPDVPLRPSPSPSPSPSWLMAISLSHDSLHCPPSSHAYNSMSNTTAFSIAALVRPEPD